VPARYAPDMSGVVGVRDWVYRALRDAGTTEELIPRIERVLSTFVLGFAASEVSGRFTVGKQELDLDMTPFAERVLNALPDPNRTPDRSTQPASPIKDTDSK
jgi:hypothetical protein